MTADGGEIGSRRSDPADQIQARIEIPCSHLGVAPPPAVVHLRLARHLEGWLIYLWNREGIQEPLLAWLGKYLDLEPVRHGTKRPRLVTAVAPELPEAWRPLVEDLSVELMVFDPAGKINLNLRGPRSALRRFLDLIGAEKTEIGDGTEVHGIGPAEDEARILTDRQREVLMYAISAGYFQVPRKLGLKELADDLEMSEGALSELLRRGEGRVLNWFFDQEVGMGSPMQPPDERGGQG